MRSWTDAVWTCARSDLRRRWLSWVVLGLLAGVTVGLACAGFAGARRIAPAMSDYMTVSGIPDAAVLPNSEAYDADVRAEVARLPEVEATTPFMVPFYLEVTSPAGMELDAPADSCASGRSWGNRSSTGRSPDPDRADEIAINEVLSKQFDLQVGDTITVAQPALGRPSRSPVPGATGRQRSVRGDVAGGRDRQRRRRRTRLAAISGVLRALFATARRADQRVRVPARRPRRSPRVSSRCRGDHGRSGEHRERRGHVRHPFDGEGRRRRARRARVLRRRRAPRRWRARRSSARPRRDRRSRRPADVASARFRPAHGGGDDRHPGRHHRDRRCAHRRRLRPRPVATLSCRLLPAVPARHRRARRLGGPRRRRRRDVDRRLRRGLDDRLAHRAPRRSIGSPAVGAGALGRQAGDARTDDRRDPTGGRARTRQAGGAGSIGVRGRGRRCARGRRLPHTRARAHLDRRRSCSGGRDLGSGGCS